MVTGRWLYEDSVVVIRSHQPEASLYSSNGRGGEQNAVYQRYCCPVAIIVGYGLTLLIYTAGDPFVQPALFLARLFSADRGGDTLLPAFLVVNTVLCAIPVYLGLRWATSRLRNRAAVHHCK